MEDMGNYGYTLFRTIPIDHRLPLLQHLAKTFTQCFCSFVHDLTAEHIAHRVLYHLALLIAIVAGELREVLKAQTNCYFIATGCGNEVVKSTEIDGRELVNNH